MIFPDFPSGSSVSNRRKANRGGQPPWPCPPFPFFSPPTRTGKLPTFFSFPVWRRSRDSTLEFRIDPFPLFNRMPLRFAMGFPLFVSAAKQGPAQRKDGVTIFSFFFLLHTGNVSMSLFLTGPFSPTPPPFSSFGAKLDFPLSLLSVNSATNKESPFASSLFLFSPSAASMSEYSRVSSLSS